MIIRSWLFVPGDSERKLEKGRENVADALILDLEDSVSNDRQEIARTMVREYLQKHTCRSRQKLYVRCNPLDTDLALPDSGRDHAGQAGWNLPAESLFRERGEHALQLSLSAGSCGRDRAGLDQNSLCRDRDRGVGPDLSHLSRRGQRPVGRYDLGGGRRRPRSVPATTVAPTAITTTSISK